MFQLTFGFQLLKVVAVAASSWPSARFISSRFRVTMLSITSIHVSSSVNISRLRKRVTSFWIPAIVVALENANVCARDRFLARFLRALSPNRPALKPSNVWKTIAEAASLTGLLKTTLQHAFRILFSCSSTHVMLNLSKSISGEFDTFDTYMRKDWTASMNVYRMGLPHLLTMVY